MKAYLLLLCGGLLLTVGDIVFRTKIKHLFPFWYLIGMFFYIVGLVFLVRTYFFENIAIASAIIVIMNIVILTLVEWFWFHDQITYLQILGMAMAFGAIVFLHS